MMKKRKFSLGADEAQRVSDEAQSRSNTMPAKNNETVELSKKLTDEYFNDLYIQNPDFKELARKDPAFEKLWNENKKDFFEDPECFMQLTKTLLRLGFGLKVELPDDRLCPPVANRHNYILWIKKLLDSTNPDDKDQKVVGLDIGTGASCIYPLLGCTQRPWTFIATDIDDRSIQFARKNVALNNLQDRITILQRDPSDTLIPETDHPLTFTMTNPPFYTSAEEMQRSAASKSLPPLSACTGAPIEMVTPGGEQRFVGRILTESLALRDHVRWYTAMFGFLASLVSFVEELRLRGVDNYAVTELVQGSRTKRWAVAWSFGARRPADGVARGMRHPARVLPPSTEVVVVSAALKGSVEDFAGRLAEAVSSLELLSWMWDAQRREGTGRAVDKVWGRAWRRRQGKGMEAREDVKGDGKGVKDECLLGFRVFVRAEAGQVSAGCRWLEGHDAVAFESFQGYLKTTAKAALEAS